MSADVHVEEDAFIAEPAEEEIEYEGYENLFAPGEEDDEDVRRLPPSDEEADDADGSEIDGVALEELGEEIRADLAALVRKFNTYALHRRRGGSE
jgi:hypothetical protein